MSAAGESSRSRINWGSFRTAFGEATEVPALLAALNDPDPGVRRSASWDLAERLHHQGCLSSAAIPATRCLLPIALNGGAPGREDALVKLIYLAAAAAPDDTGLTGELSEGVLNALREAKAELVLAVSAETKPAFAAGLLYLLCCISNALSESDMAVVDRVGSVSPPVGIVGRVARIVHSNSLGMEDPEVVRDEVLEALEASD